MNKQIPTAILLIGHDHQDAEGLSHFQQLAARLATRLGQIVIPCPLDQSGNPILDGIRAGLQQGAVKFVALPLFLSPAEYQKNSVADAITWASRRWSFLSFHVSPTLDWVAWTSLLTSAVKAYADDLTQTGVLLGGLTASAGEAASDSDAESQSDLAKLGHLLLARNAHPRVELAFLAPQQEPLLNHRALCAQLEKAIRHCQLAQAEQIIALPAFFFCGAAYATLAHEIDQLARVFPLQIELAKPLEQEPLLLDLLAQQYEAALADDSLLAVSWDEVRRQVEASVADHRPQPLASWGDAAGNVPPADEGQFQSLTQRVNAILPPRYQNGKPVSAIPMASADLQFDETGAVAWDKMWGLDDPDSPFCELALAGGPPHRGNLLEPVGAAACEAAPGKYAAVLAELARGINLVAGLSTVASGSLGWVGVQCDSDEMAIWLLRAIIVENVMARREANVLYLPAGPDFMLQREIKNVVTVVAKTVHYWQEHISTRQFLTG